MWVYCILAPLLPLVAAVTKDHFVLDATMPAMVPTKNEQYSCTAAKVKKEGYIVTFNPVASVDRVHHMILFGCDEPGDEQPYWDCMGMTCRGRTKILYAWARNAPSLQLPDNVGFHIGGDSGIKYLVVQVHYAKTFEGQVEDFSGVSTVLQADKPQFLADIYLFAAGMSPIPKETPTYFMNMSCTFSDTPPNKPSIFAFAFRTHTHDLGRVVSAFKKHKGKWTMIGKRNPLWPQMFQTIPTPIEIQPGDILSGQCRFNSSNRHESTSIGAHGANEMCNFYMMYYRDSSSVDPFAQSYSGCSSRASPEIIAEYPEEGSALLPRKLQLEEAASLDSHNFVRHYRSSDYYPASSRRRPNVERKPEPYFDSGSDRPKPRQWKDKNVPLSLPVAKSEVSGGSVHSGPSGVGRVVEKWAMNEFGGVKLGQVAGLAIDPHGQVFIFHRGNRVWDGSTFTGSHELRDKSPVNVDPIVIIDPTSQPPKLIKSYGKSMFYMPHGIFVDCQNRIWTTDTGSHQVNRFEVQSGELIVTGTWGELFVPGSDDSHFCQPSGVAVTQNGEFFVSDGYCNSRIMHFDANGKLKAKFGERTLDIPPALGSFILPHDVTLHEQMQHVHVADRMNGRMQMIFFNGTPIYELTPPKEFTTVYSADFCVATNRVYLLPGEPPERTGDKIRAFAVEAKKEGHTMYSFAPTSTDFKRPHVLRVSPDCRYIYVADLGDDEHGSIFKFEVKSKSIGKATNGKCTKGVDASPHGSPSPSKPIESADALLSSGHSGRLWLALASVFTLTSLSVLLLCLCLKFRKQGGFKSTNVRLGDNRYSSSRKLLNGSSFRDSREGFMPLPTADIDAVDDLTDDSEFEDTLYTSNHANSRPTT